MIIRVSNHDIAMGERNSEDNDPICHAIRDEIRGAKVEVHQDRIEINGVAYPTPAIVASKVHDWDATGAMMPFEFELDYVAPARPDLRIPAGKIRCK